MFVIASPSDSRSEEDRKRVRLALLVDPDEPPPEIALRNGNDAAHLCEPALHGGPLSRDSVDLRAQRVDAGLLLAEPALERVEVDKAE